MTIPKSTFTGAASGAQAGALAREIVDANNSTMQQFDQADGRLDRLKATGSKDAPLSVIDQDLVNVPHKFYKVTGIGDLYAPKNAPMQVEARYQSVRIIAAYSASALPALPKG